MLLLAAALALLMHFYPEKLRAPLWVGFWAAGLLGLGGVCVILLALRKNAAVRWLVCCLLAAMAVLPAWIATSGAATQCTSGSQSMRVAVSEATCRGAFGFGSVLVFVMFVFAVRDAIQKHRR